jgi:hypothetical protein
MKMALLKKILRGVRYSPLPKLIDQHVEVHSIETIEADLLTAFRNDLPPESRLISKERYYIEGALVKYGLMDVMFSVSSEYLDACPPITGKMLRDFGFALSPEDRENLAQNSAEDFEEDTALWELLIEDLDKNQPIIKLFLGSPNHDAMGGLRNLLSGAKASFPKKLLVRDACLTNSSSIWFWKHFYL